MADNSQYSASTVNHNNLIHRSTHFNSPQQLQSHQYSNTTTASIQNMNHQNSNQKAFSYFHSPQQMLSPTPHSQQQQLLSIQKYSSSNSNENNNLQMMASYDQSYNQMVPFIANSNALLQTQTAITDDSYCELPHKPTANNQISSLHQHQRNTVGQSNNHNLSNYEVLQGKGSDQMIKSLSNIKVHVSCNNPSKNVPQTMQHNYSQAKLKTFRQSEQDMNNNHQHLMHSQSKEFGSLVVLSEEGCKSESKIKINSSRVMESQMHQYQLVNSQNQNLNKVNSHHNQSHHSIKHPKQSVILATNKLSQLSQNHQQQKQLSSSTSMLHYQSLKSPYSVSSSQSTTSLKMHISQQHQLSLQQQNSVGNRMLQSNTDSNYHSQPHQVNNTVNNNLAQSLNNKKAMYYNVKSSTSINSMRESNDMLKSTDSDKVSQGHHDQTSGVGNTNNFDKRTSINSYNKRVVELHLNNNNSINNNLLKVVPQTMKHQNIKQLNLDISDSSKEFGSKYPSTKVEIIPGKHINQTIESHSQAYQTSSHSITQSNEKMRPQIKVIPISTNISPKNQTIFGSPRFSINSINNTVIKSKLMIRKQQPGQSQTLNGSKSGVINLNRSEQQQQVILSKEEKESIYNQGQNTVQVNQSQTILNFKQQNSSPQFNRFIQQSKTSQNSQFKKNQQSNATVNNNSQQTLIHNQSQNQQSSQLLRNLSSEGAKQLRISESSKDLKFNSSKTSQALESHRLTQNQSAFENKRESQRYYSPNHQISLNKALSRISSVGELKKAKQQIATQRKSIQNKLPGSTNQTNSTGLSTILTAHIVMQNAQRKPIKDYNSARQQSRSQDRKLTDANNHFEKSTTNQIFDNDMNEVQDDDDNEYMTNQEKLWNAIETNLDYQIIEELLKKSDVKVDQKNVFDDSWTALHYAVHEGNMPVIKLLIEKYGASIDQRSATNKTPFHLACIRGDSLIIKFLLESGASSHVVDRDGCTPLHYLCETENIEMVRFLLPVAGPSKDVRNRFGKKPVDLIQDKEMKRLLRNYSQRRESQSRMTSQQSKDLESQPKSLSRERSRSGGNKIIQINRLNDDKEVQDQIQQMFRKFSLYQRKQVSKERLPLKSNTKEETKTQNNGNMSQRNVISPTSNQLNANQGKKFNYPTHRLTLAPSASNKSLPQSQLQASKTVKKQNTTNNKNFGAAQNVNQQSTSNLILKNISPTKQINLAPTTTQKQNTSLSTSQSVRNLNTSTTPTLQSVKSQGRLDFSSQQASTKKLATVASVTNLLQQKQKQLEENRKEQIKQQDLVKPLKSRNDTQQSDKFERSKDDYYNKSGGNGNGSSSLQKKAQPKVNTRSQQNQECKNNLVQSDQKQQQIIDDQGSLSQRTGDSSSINNDQITNSIVNKNHKLTTFSLNQISDSNGQDIEEKNKQEQEQRVGPWSFIAHQLLGTGSFGEVFLVEKISNGKFFAMKVLTKSKIMGHNLTRYALTERNVMSIVNHPFIVKLNYAFQTQEKLFLILDYCPGGDLAEYLQLEKRFNEDKVRLYSSEILLALEELHRQDIIFRDLKPDNVVLDHEGHAMLTDFGLSKEGVMKEGMAKSFCGSYAYLAPEMLKKIGHGKAVDWYLLGVIIYEMLCGVPPYYANNKEELFENIKNAQLDIPQYVSPVSKDLILRLLNRNPKKRMGTIGGADEIKKHPFFKNIDWNKLYHRAYRAPEPYLRKRFENFLQMSPALQTNAEVYESLRKQALFKGHGEPEQHIPGWSFVSPVKEHE